jgi:scyllo-inositol 2-dehydrogenase (NADP+)
MPFPRVAIIGYGFAGRCFHSYLVSITPGLILHGIASRDAATRARIVAERGCRTYESLDQVLDDPAIDLVVLATPNHTHAAQAIQALQAGKHVVTDKVMCLTLADCEAMIAAAHTSGRLLSVFQNRRWDGDFLTLQAAIAAGLLGEVRWVEMAWGGFGAWGGWRGQAGMGGGKLYDLGAHLIDQLALLFPQAIESVYCRMHHDFSHTDTESQAQVVIGFAGGATGICDTSSLMALPKPRIQAFGTGGTFQKYGLDPQEAAMIAGDIDAAREDAAHFARLADGQSERRLPTQPGRWRTYYENIRDVLTLGAEPLVKLTEVRRAIQILDAAWQSARSGEVVRPSADCGVRSAELPAGAQSGQS